MLHTTTLLTRWLRRLAQATAFTTPRSSLATVRAHCPHCDQETSWAAHAASGFYRCLRCGHDPLVSPDASDEA